MNVVPTALPEVLQIVPDVHRDARGAFFESYNAQRFADAGITARFVQDNVSISSAGTLRGLHFQHPRDQAKLLQVLEGAIFDVAVDVRIGSPDFGRWAGVTLSADNQRQLFVPKGFAHGFYVVSPRAVVVYKCDDYYAPDVQVAVRWNDPDVGIEWPDTAPTLSARDASAKRLCDVDPARLPRYASG